MLLNFRARIDEEFGDCLSFDQLIEMREKGEIRDNQVIDEPIILYPMKPGMWSSNGKVSARHIMISGFKLETYHDCNSLGFAFTEWWKRIVNDVTAQLLGRRWSGRRVVHSDFGQVFMNMIFLSSILLNTSHVVFVDMPNFFKQHFKNITWKCNYSSSYSGYLPFQF